MARPSGWLDMKGFVARRGRAAPWPRAGPRPGRAATRSERPRTCLLFFASSVRGRRARTGARQLPADPRRASQAARAARGRGRAATGWHSGSTLLTAGRARGTTPAGRRDSMWSWTRGGGAEEPILHGPDGGGGHRGHVVGGGRGAEGGAARAGAPRCSRRRRRSVVSARGVAVVKGVGAAGAAAAPGRAATGSGRSAGPSRRPARAAISRQPRRREREPGAGTRPPVMHLPGPGSPPPAWTGSAALLPGPAPLPRAQTPHDPPAVRSLRSPRRRRAPRTAVRPRGRDRGGRTASGVSTTVLLVR